MPIGSAGSGPHGISILSASPPAPPAAGASCRLGRVQRPAVPMAGARIPPCGMAGAREPAFGLSGPFIPGLGIPSLGSRSPASGPPQSLGARH